MTEAEWFGCNDPLPMLEVLRAAASDRKLRLFACACCRRVWHVVQYHASRRAVDVAERWADGAATAAELAAALQEATEAMGQAAEDYDHAVLAGIDYVKGGPDPGDWEDHAAAAEQLARAIPGMFRDPPAGAAAEVARAAAAAQATWEVGLFEQERRSQAERAQRGAEAALIREVFGNPFRPGQVDRAWLAWNAGTVVKLAHAIYDGPRFGDMPVLADALEEAGCTDADLLGHCRAGGEHVRGCWAVDLLLGRS
jgi:hypothetical protein